MARASRIGIKDAHRIGSGHDPFEHAQYNANTYNDGFLDRPFVVVPMQTIAGKLLQRMKDFPPSQPAGSGSK